MKKNNVMWMLLFGLVAVFTLGTKVQAATPTIYEFKSSYDSSEQTYTGMDVTGDEKNDTVKVKFTEYNYGFAGACKIYVNGEQVLTEKDKYGRTWSIGLIRLENGKVLFDVHSGQESCSSCRHKLYLYKKGKLKMVCDVQKNFEKYSSHYDVDVIGVEGNKVQMEAYAMFNVTGIIRYNMEFVYKNGKMKPTSNQYDIIYTSGSPEWTVAKKITVYKSAGSKVQVFTLKKGEKVYLDKVIHKKNKPYIKVRKKSGKVGYIPCPTQYSYPHYFEECMFAG